MKNIEKKILPEYFELILSGEKTFELRLADWNCRPGDTLILREFNKDTQSYTGRETRKKVGYVAKTKDITLFPKEDIDAYGYQIISLLDEAVA